MIREKIAEKLRDFTFQSVTNIQNSSKNNIYTFDIIYEEYSSLLFSFIKKIIPDDKISEEIFIDIFFSIKKNINKYEIISVNPYPWIIFLARNIAIDYLRNDRKKISNKIIPEEYEERFILPVISPFINKIKPSGKLKEKAEHAVDSLTEMQQYILYKIFYEGLTDYEIAAELNIPPSAIKHKINSALNNLLENIKGFSFYKSDNNILITSFALCSLNKDEYDSCGEVIKNNNILLKNLSYYQEIISLLPLLPDIQNPPKDLKEKIIKKYIIFEEESREKEAAEFIKKINDNRKREEKYKIPEVDNQVRGNKDSVKDENLFSLKSMDDEKAKWQRVRSTERYYSLKEKKKNILYIFLSIIFIASVVLIYFSLSDKIDDMQEQNKKLSAKISELYTLSQNYNDLENILSAKNIEIVNLKGSGTVPASGKLFLNMDDRKGYLVLTDAGSLKKEKSYGIYFIAPDSKLILSEFIFSEEVNFYSFNIQRLPVKENTSVVISDLAEDYIYLEGNLSSLLKSLPVQ